MKIALIGTGKVATHLAERLKALTLNVQGVLGSSADKTRLFSNEFSISPLDSYSNLVDYDLCLVCVQDSKLTEVLTETTKYCNSATISGTYNISAITTSKFKLGVFYPLQSFSKEAIIDFSKIPFFIESKDRSFENELLELADLIGKSGISMKAEDRVHLHLTAVFINNFTHHVSVLGREYASDNNIEFEWFDALIDETFRKIKAGALTSDQTGPAQRNDIETITKHLSLLSNMKAEVYKTLTESIKKSKLNDQL